MPRTGGRVGRVLAVLSQAAGLGPSGLTASAASAAGAQWIVLDPVVVLSLGGSCRALLLQNFKPLVSFTHIFF